MSKFVRSNPKDGSPPRLPGVTQQRHHAEQVSLGETYHLHGDAELKREIESSLAIIARERLLEVETQAKSFLTRSQDEAAKILERANAQAREMISQARVEEEGIREKAYEEGFKTGFEEGYSDATAQVTEETQALLKGAQTLVDGAYLAEQRVLQHFEGHTLELIRHLVRQILHRELTDSPETTMHMIRRALERLYMTGKVQVVVSAQIIHDLRSYNAATEGSLAEMHRFEFVADPILEPDQIYIIGQDGCFDLSPETQLEQYLSAIKPQLVLPRTVPEPAEPTPLSTPLPVPDISMDVAAEPFTAILTPEIVNSAILNPESTAPIEPNEEDAPVAEAIPEAITETDPVAWEAFPTEIQELGGFSGGMNELITENAMPVEPERVIPADSMPVSVPTELAAPLTSSKIEPVISQPSVLPDLPDSGSESESPDLNTEGEAHS